MLTPENMFFYIKMIYTQAGLNQGEVAKKAEISPSHLAQLERGLQRCPLPTFLTICRAVNVKLCEFEDVETVEKSLAKMKTSRASLEKIKQFNKQIQKIEEARDLEMSAQAKEAQEN